MGKSMKTESILLMIQDSLEEKQVENDCYGYKGLNSDEILELDSDEEFPNDTTKQSLSCIS